VCETRSLRGGSGDMPSDVTAVTTNCAASGALCVRPGGRQAVCAYRERCGTPARTRDVRTRVRTYGLTDVIDPGGNTVTCRNQPGGRPHRHAWVAPAVGSSNTRDPYATRSCLRPGTLTSKARLIGRRSPVPSSGLDPYIAGHRVTEATLIQRAWGRAG
jgi:hypothetical protein